MQGMMDGGPLSTRSEEAELQHAYYGKVCGTVQLRSSNSTSQLNILEPMTFNQSFMDSSGFLATLASG